MRRSSRAEVPRLKNSRTKIEAVGGGGEEKGSLGVWVLGLNCPLSSLGCPLFWVLEFNCPLSSVGCPLFWGLGGSTVGWSRRWGQSFTSGVEAACPLRRREGRGWQASLIREALLRFSFLPKGYRIAHQANLPQTRSPGQQDQFTDAPVVARSLQTARSLGSIWRNAD